MSADKPYQLPAEVQEIVMICVLGLICYFIMVCCILCRRPPELAVGLLKDVKVDTFLRREPQDYDGYFHAASDIEVVRKATASHCGRLMIDRGFATFLTEKGERYPITRGCYATFDKDEKFSLTEMNEEVLFHLDLYELMFEIEDANRSATKHE